MPTYTFKCDFCEFTEKTHDLLPTYNMQNHEKECKYNPANKNYNIDSQYPYFNINYNLDMFPKRFCVGYSSINSAKDIIVWMKLLLEKDWSSKQMVMEFCDTVAKEKRIDITHTNK